MKRMIMIGMLPLLLSIACGDESHRHQRMKKAWKEPATRIVVADYGALDTIDQLGKSANIVGLPKQMLPTYLHNFSDTKYTDIGGLKSLDIETIRQLTPDLIIISGRQAGSFHALNEIAPTIRYHFKPHHYQRSFEKNVRHLALALGDESSGDDALIPLRKLIKENQIITEGSPLKAVVLLHNEEKLFASSTNRMAEFIHDVVGVKEADEALLDRSELVTTLYLNRIDPDIIYLMDRSAAVGRELFDKTYFENEAIRDIKAIKNGQIIYLTPDLWFFGGDGLESIPLQMKEVMTPFMDQLDAAERVF